MVDKLIDLYYYQEQYDHRKDYLCDLLKKKQGETNVLPKYTGMEWMIRDVLKI